jgi:hypothetical protein
LITVANDETALVPVTIIEALLEPKLPVRAYTEPISISIGELPTATEFGSVRGLAAVKITILLSAVI